MELRVALLCLAALASAQASICPTSCVCSTTPDGLHKAICSNLLELCKFLERQKTHNINILDLSHNNITKLAHHLDRMTELVALDLSTNGFTEIDRFPRNSAKLVHLNLANNRLRHFSFSVLPKSVSSLDLSNNLLADLPENLRSLPGLEHLQMEGNPLDCSCSNLLLRDYLWRQGVAIDDVKCESPVKLKGLMWFDLKTQEVCRISSMKMATFDHQKGMIAETMAKDSLSLKFIPSKSFTDLDEGQTWVGSENARDYDGDDEVVFLRAKREEPSISNNIEGSGFGDTIEKLALNEETTTNDLNLDVLEDKDIIQGRTIEGSGFTDTMEMSTLNVETTTNDLSPAVLKGEEIIQGRTISQDDAIEGSGEGSDFESIDTDLKYEPEDVDEDFKTTTTSAVKELYTDPVHPFLGNEVVEEDTEIPFEFMPSRPSVYMGPQDWFNSTSTDASPTTESPAGGAEKIQIEKTGAIDYAATNPDEKSAVHRTGTYVCVAIIVVLLVGLILFAVIKGQIRRRRDRRMQRKQKRDIEKASKEMVDMNTSLLGKPAPQIIAGDRKVKGKYELVPTHDSANKKTENGTLNGTDLNKDKGSPRDNNQNRPDERPRSLGAAQTAPASPDSKKDVESLSSEEIIIPEIGVSDATDVTQSLVNGDGNTDTDHLSPSRDYVPVYSPDMGRVRIKLAETPKPKTPVLVNRSRSNAGDIIVTPALVQSLPDAAT